MQVLTVNQMPVSGKRVLLRVDFNVPLQNGKVADDSRIRAALPTIRHLIERRARVILVTHLGRPKGTAVPELRLDPVAAALSELLERPVKKLDQVIGDQVAEAVGRLNDGEVLLLENVRFLPGEERNDPELARQLSELADLFVNDAFGTAHRAHASTAGVARYIPAAAGLLMQKEIEVLSRCLEQPRRPLVAILGGAKVSDKIGVISRFMELADVVLTGGGMANTFLVAAGYDLKDSFFEQDSIEQAHHFLNRSKTGTCRLYLPVDLVEAAELKPDAPFNLVVPEAVSSGYKVVDIGPETIRNYSEVVSGAGTVVWNGPLGVFEVPPFHRGTEGVARAVAQSKAFSVVGGGDVVAALEKTGLAGQVDFVSTGGGATLEFWEGKELPGIAVLKEQG